MTRPTFSPLLFAVPCLLVATCAFGSAYARPDSDGAVAELGGPAAPSVAPSPNVSLYDTLRRGGWQFGGWPSALPGDRSGDDTLNAMSPKPRSAGWVVPLRLADEATLRSWSGGVRRADGSVEVSSGLLMDVSLGAFTFTPSLGATFGGGARGTGTGGDAPTRLRSQFEVGYQFGNTSQLVLGYGRVTALGAIGEGWNDNDVVSLTYRLPFGSLLDW